MRVYVCMWTCTEQLTTTMLMLRTTSRANLGIMKLTRSLSTAGKGWSRTPVFGHRERAAEEYLSKKEWTIDHLISKRRALKEGTGFAKQATVNWIAHDDTVLNAVKTMVSCHVGSLLVYQNADLTDKTNSNNPRKNWVGIVTERDYLGKIAVRNLTSSTTKVLDIMTPRASIVTATLDHSLYECLHLFENATFRHLPIITSRVSASTVEEEEVVAVLSQRDIVTEFRSFHEATVKYMEHFIEFPIW